MARNRYIKSYSNYTLKQIHQTTNIGTITERNFMTIADLNDYPMGGLPSYGLNGFKMVIDDGINLKKRHRYGSWLKNELCEDSNGYWSLNCMVDEDNELISNSPEIELKPNYNSILDFAFYGSATKLVESAIVNIVKMFPGEVYLREDYVIINDTKLYKVDNPFNIEFDTIYFDDKLVENPLRVFSKSFENYRLFTKSGDVGTLSWNRSIMSNNPCDGDGSYLSAIELGSPFLPGESLYLYYYNYNGKKQLFHDGTFVGGSIKPTNKVINKFFKNLNDFEKLLLNKKTNYTAYLETPQETKNGNISYKKPYSWPKTGIGTWNIDIKSVRYEEYVDSLLEIAEFYDSYFTDNLWSSLTHEAIINFDWTLSKVNENGYETEFASPNSQRMKAFMQIAGRNFDNLKRYIDGISHSNKVTYDESNNNPDYFLSDTLTNYGWDVKTPIPSSLSKFMTNPLYTGHVDGYTVQEANNELYRRLLLNTQAILSAKGTKRAIEMVLSLFGYRSLNFVEHTTHTVKRNGEYVILPWSKLYDDEKQEIYRNVYDITEYVYVTGSGSTAFDDGVANGVKKINSLKMSYDYENNNELQGLPLREVITTVNEPILGKSVVDGALIDDVVIGHNNVQKNYLIPWYDKNEQYDADTYFESKGGWGLTLSKTNDILDYGEKAYETGDGLKIYDESIKYLKFKETLSDLINGVGELPEVNEVYYVYDISGGDKYDWGLLGDEAKPEMSHYFILKDAEHDGVFGVLRDEEGNVIVEDGTGVHDSEKNGTYRLNPKDVEGYPNIFWKVYPEKKYGWKNISERELQEGTSKDAQRVFYLEGIVENNLGNNPHVGYGDYDDGEDYKVFFEDVFKTAREDGEFEGVSDEELEYGSIQQYNEKTHIFVLNKEIDNVKCWYFTDLSEEHDLYTLSKVDEHTYNPISRQTSNVGGGKFVRYYEDRSEEGINETQIDNPLFSSLQYPIMTPVNMENGDTDDEAAANSIINSKSLFIEFLPDLKSPISMYEFIDDVAMHYAKQVIPSSTLFKYKVPMTGLDVFCYHRTYIQSAIVNN